MEISSTGKYGLGRRGHGRYVSNYGSRFNEKHHPIQRRIRHARHRSRERTGAKRRSVVPPRVSVDYRHPRRPSTLWAMG